VPDISQDLEANEREQERYTGIEAKSAGGTEIENATTALANGF